VILAGGRGTRLKPFTASFPKVLVPLGDIPVLEVLIRSLRNQGLTDITLALGYLAELVQAYFHHREPLIRDLTLRYVIENKPTGTAGPLAMVSGLDETFLVMNGDLLTDIDFRHLVAFHRQQGAVLTIATHQRRIQIDLGTLEFDGSSRVTAYREKPEHTYHASMGVYVYEPSVLRFIEPGQYLDFPDLVHRLLEAGQPVCTFLSDCLWLDIGRPDDYARAQQLYAENREKFQRGIASDSAQ
jgi:NDP-sugar pyrophosphorylase family protein